jgi:cytochrome c oxidase subunit 2
MAMRRRQMMLATGSLLLAAGAVAFKAAAQPQEQVIKIVARRYVYTPNEISVKMGIPVLLQLTTADVLMGFSLPDFHVRADIIPDKVAEVRFVPDKAGSFEFVCDIFCGSGHESMNGTLTVTA